MSRHSFTFILMYFIILDAQSKTYLSILVRLSYLNRQSNKFHFKCFIWTILALILLLENVYDSSGDNSLYCYEIIKPNSVKNM
jgi:hypothetical protein